MTFNHGLNESEKKFNNTNIMPQSIKLSTDQKLTKEEITEIQKLQTELSEFVTERTLQNKMDLAFFKKIEKRASG